MIDRYDAPKGMVAVRCKEPPCEGCFFENKRGCPTRGNSKAIILCDIEYRKDGESVIFVTRADFEKMLMQEIERFYGKGKVKRIIFTKVNVK